MLCCLLHETPLYCCWTSVTHDQKLLRLMDVSQFDRTSTSGNKRHANGEVKMLNKGHYQYKVSCSPPLPLRRYVPHWHYVSGTGILPNSVMVSVLCLAVYFPARSRHMSIESIDQAWHFGPCSKYREVPPSCVLEQRPFH